jgi:hypothetical protein
MDLRSLLISRSAEESEEEGSGRRRNEHHGRTRVLADPNERGPLLVEDYGGVLHAGSSPGSFVSTVVSAIVINDKTRRGQWLGRTAAGADVQEACGLLSGKEGPACARCGCGRL